MTMTRNWCPATVTARGAAGRFESTVDLVRDLLRDHGAVVDAEPFGRVWSNQTSASHPSALPPLPRNVLFGDGRPIPASVVKVVGRESWRLDGVGTIGVEGDVER